MSAEPQRGAQDDVRYFGHAPRLEGHLPLQHATRYLSAGTYLSGWFEQMVISELVHGWHRAVAPSYGFDLEVVARHALRSRRWRLQRDVAVIVLWTVALVAAPLLTAGVGMLLIGIVAALLAVGGQLAGRTGLMLLAVGAGGLLLAPVLAAMVFLLSNWPGGGVSFPTEGLPYPGGEPPVSDDGGGLVEPGTLIALLALAGIGAVGYLYFARLVRTLAEELAPGAHGPGPVTGGPDAEAALLRLGAAQQGNITLYADQSPFLGAGHVGSRDALVWSIILGLDRPAEDSRPVARVDPVVLYDRVREAAAAMRDEWPPSRPGHQEPAPDQRLPVNERVVSMIIADHVTGHGVCDQRRSPAAPSGGHPLVDPWEGRPYSKASRPALEAIMRHPQAAARYFLRIAVGAQSQQVVGPGGRILLDAEEQDFSLTTFVHLAVEGRMLYAQFAAVPLTPIREDFRIVDRLPAPGGAGLRGATVRLWLHETPVASVLAVPQTVLTLWQMARGSFGARRDRAARRDVTYNYGARLSVRQAAAAPDFTTYMQLLDVKKYTRMVQERVNDAILDHLENECGIDVTAYRAQAQQITSQTVTIGGNVTGGQIAVGTGFQMRQQNK